MIPITSLPITRLVPVGDALLLGSFGWSVIRALRKGESVEESIVALFLAMLAIQYYAGAFQWLDRIGVELRVKVEEMGSPDQLKDLIWEALKTSAYPPVLGSSHSSLNLPELAEQVVRTGVWGVMSAVADFFFLLADLFLDVRRKVLWQLLGFLFPIAWGIYPAFPFFGRALVGYALEVALWGPCLALVNLATSLAARGYFMKPGSLGLYVVAVECVAIYLMLDIPKTTHQLLSGALHPSGESEALGLVFVGSRAVKAAQATAVKTAREAARASGAVLCVALLLSTGLSSGSAWARERFPVVGVQASSSSAIRLYAGYLTQAHCRGRLLGAGVGNDALVEREALPASLGCGLLLKPLATQGRTNLVVMTSVGSFNRGVEIISPSEGQSVDPAALDLDLGTEGLR